MNMGFMDGHPLLKQPLLVYQAHRCPGAHRRYIINSSAKINSQSEAPSLFTLSGMYFISFLWIAFLYFKTPNAVPLVALLFP
jgi:hypothetical protein